MKELGSEELQLHYETGEYAKNSGIDLVVAVGELSKELAKASGGKWFADIDSAMKSLENLLCKGDTVLVKASHSMQFENIVEFLRTLDLTV